MTKPALPTSVRKLAVFTSLTLDGYFVGDNGDMNWAHKHDDEWNRFVAGNAKGECEMIFGRVTYARMASWWPTPQAKDAMATVAERMNAAPKVVFSRTMKKATWQNTRLMQTDAVSAVRKLKQEPGPMLLILGSGSIVAQLAEAGLVDEIQIALNPVALGKGRTLFQGVTTPLAFQLTETRAFQNGNVFLRYKPVAP